MLVRALKSFPFSVDGKTAQPAVAGQLVDIPDDLVPGLQAEGWVSADLAGSAEAPAGAAIDQMSRGELESEVVHWFIQSLAGASAEQLRSQIERERRYHLDAASGGAVEGEDGADGDDDFLMGSSELGAVVRIAGIDVQLGGLVMASHRESGLSVGDWNALDPAAREERLAATLARLDADPEALEAEIDPHTVIPSAQLPHVETPAAALAAGGDFNGADPATFDHDGDGLPGGSLAANSATETPGDERSAEGSEGSAGEAGGEQAPSIDAKPAKAAKAKG